jgi:hypothetical protein
MHKSPVALVWLFDEISRNNWLYRKVRLAWYQIIFVSWVFIYAELLCHAIRHGLILLIILFYYFVAIYLSIKNYIFFIFYLIFLL